MRHARVTMVFGLAVALGMGCSAAPVPSNERVASESQQQVTAPPFPIPFPQMPSHAGVTLPKLQLQSVSWAGDSQGGTYAQQFGDYIVGSQWLQQITAEYHSPFQATNANQTLPGLPSGPVDAGAILSSSLQSGALSMPTDTTGLLYMFWVPSAYCSLSFHSSISYAGTYIAFAQVCGYGVVPLPDGGTELTGSMSHELAEAITDPYPTNGYVFDATDGAWLWGGPTKGEVADVCLNDVNVGAYQLTSVWSNQAALAGGSPCIPYPSGDTYYNVSPSAPNVASNVWNTAPLAVSAGGSVQITLQGWSKPVDNGSWNVFLDTPPDSQYALGATLSTGTMTQGGTATLTLSVPQGTPVGQTAYALVRSGSPGKSQGTGAWPFEVEVAACNATSCPSGCCNGNNCVPYASQNSSECGSGGLACAACAAGGVCEANGTCCTPYPQSQVCAGQCGGGNFPNGCGGTITCPKLTPRACCISNGGTWTGTQCM